MGSCGRALAARATVAVLLGVAWGCASSGAFACDGDDTCVSGMCQPTGFCSFPDSDCDSGQRYDAFAGQGLAGHCVDPSGGDADSSTTSVGTSTTTGEGGSGDAGTTGPPQSWWDDGWSVRHRIDVDNAAVTEALTDIPVMVALDSSRIDLSRTQPNGADLRFVGSDDQTVLDYEIERWEPTAVSYLWVKLPRIDPSGTSTSFQLYYGNPEAPPDEQGAAVWSNAFSAVWHFDAGPTDSTVFSLDGDGVATASAPGHVGGACLFDSVDAYVEVAPDPVVDGIFETGATISAWIRPATWGESNYGRIADKTGDNPPTAGFSFQLVNVADRQGLQFDRGGVSEGVWRTPVGVIALDRWQFVALTHRDGETPTFYIDGVAVPSEEERPWMGPALPDDQLPLYIGNTFNLTRDFEGLLDEVRIASEVRSPNFVDVQFRSASDTLLSFGPAQTR